MTAYAMAHVHDVEFCPDIVEYLERIDATMDPFGGRFLVHGNPVEEREGKWDGQLILIEFPDFEQAKAWYDSPAYREILGLRTRHMECDVILVPGVPESYRGADSLSH